jgi:hypothetical protein
VDRFFIGDPFSRFENWLNCCCHKRRNLDLDLGSRIDQAGKIKQRRWREVSAKRFTPCGADSCGCRFKFATAGQIPCQADNVLGACPRLREQLDDPPQRHADLRCHIAGRIFALVIASGLACKHDPSSGTIEHNAVGEAARFRPSCRLQYHHDQVLHTLGGRSPIRRFGRSNSGASVTPIGSALTDGNVSPREIEQR